MMELAALTTGLEHTLFVSVDLLGAVVAGIGGAVAARQRRLDLFGVLTLAYLTAVAGGIFRDLCIGALPPVGLSDWRYLAAAGIGAALTLALGPLIERMAYPVAFFDALALGFYAVVGAHKTLAHGFNAEMAILLGMATAVGGGVVRDVLLNRVPVILQKEIYAVAAAAGAATQVLGQKLGWPVALTPWFGASVCIAIRLLSLHYGWQLRLPGRTPPAR